jgi:hypothetical protein
MAVLLTLLSRPMTAVIFRLLKTPDNTPMGRDGLLYRGVRKQRTDIKAGGIQCH